ncbi:hypothetical protein IJD44_02765, partial [bacterium]|nr:hypothetical protein [bacterium]
YSYFNSQNEMRNQSYSLPQLSIPYINVDNQILNTSRSGQEIRINTNDLTKLQPISTDSLRIPFNNGVNQSLNTSGQVADMPINTNDLTKLQPISTDILRMPFNNGVSQTLNTSGPSTEIISNTFESTQLQPLSINPNSYDNYNYNPIPFSAIELSNQKSEYTKLTDYSKINTMNLTQLSNNIAQSNQIPSKAIKKEIQDFSSFQNTNKEYRELEQIQENNYMKTNCLHLNELIISSSESSEEEFLTKGLEEQKRKGMKNKNKTKIEFKNDNKNINDEFTIFENKFVISGNMIEITSKQGNKITMNRTQWIESERQTALPMYDGFVFHKNNETVYSCKEKGCKCSVTIGPFGEINYVRNKSAKMHNHPPQIWDYLQKEMIELKT